MHARTEQRRRDRLVGATHRHEDREGVPTVGAQLAEHLLPDVARDGVRTGARGQLGERRPATDVAEQVGGHAARRGEAGELLVLELQVALVEDECVAVREEPAGEQRQGRSRGQHEVAGARQLLDQPGQELRSGGAGADQVRVVEDERDVPRRGAPHRLCHGHRRDVGIVGHG